MQFSAVLFDLDGTILDSFATHYAAYEATFAHFGIAITPERFFAAYSPDWYHTYREFELPEKHWDDANRYWLDEVARQSPPPFPGAGEALASMRPHYRLGIVTSGSRLRVERDLERANLLPLFEVIVTGDDVVNRKPAPEGLHRALDALGVAGDRAVYVGDARADYEMAVAAGVPFIGVESRFMSLDATCDAPRIDGVAKLPSLLRMS